jgi:hypothetical protein
VREADQGQAGDEGHPAESDGVLIRWPIKTVISVPQNTIRIQSMCMPRGKRGVNHLITSYPELMAARQMKSTRIAVPRPSASTDM